MQLAILTIASKSRLIGRLNECVIMIADILLPECRVRGRVPNPHGGCAARRIRSRTARARTQSVLGEIKQTGGQGKQGMNGSHGKAATVFYNQ